MDGTDNIRSDFWVTDEDGNDYHLDLLGFADHDNKVYVLCAPADDAQGRRSGAKTPPKVTIFELSYLNEQPRFSVVSDRELCEKVFAVYSDRIIEEQLKNM